jgi:hypothetical protein
MKSSMLAARLRYSLSSRATSAHGRQSSGSMPAPERNFGRDLHVIWDRSSGMFSLVTTQSRRGFDVYVGDSPPALCEKTKWELYEVSNDHDSGLTLSWTQTGRLLQSDFAGHAYASATDGTTRLPLLK